MRQNSDRVIFFYIFLAMSVFYLITTGGHFYTTDGEVHYRLAGSIILKRSIAVSLDQGETSRWGELTTIKGVDHRRYPKSAIGQSLAVIPLYLAGKGMSVVTGRDLTRLFVSFFNQIVAALICAAAFIFCRRLNGKQGARNG